MGPKAKRSASDEPDDALALRLVEILNDDQVLAKLKSVLFPEKTTGKIITGHVSPVNGRQVKAAREHAQSRGSTDTS